MAQTWQEKLKLYQTDITSREAELERARLKAQQQQASGDMQGYAASTKWIDQINQVGPVKTMTGQGSVPKQMASQPIITQPTVQQQVIEPPKMVQNEPLKQSDLYRQQLLEAQKNQRLNSIESAYKSGVSSLENQSKLIPEQYRQQKINADTQSQLASKSFSEYLSKRGLLNSGEASQAEITNNMALQNVKGNLSAQEQQALNEILNKRSQLDLSKASDISSAEQGYQSNLLEQQLLNATKQEDKALLDAEKLRNQEIALDMANPEKYANDYQAEINRRLATPSKDDDMLIPQLEKLRMDKINQRDINTISQYSNDYQAEINRRLATPDSQDDNLIPYLQDARQGKLTATQKQQQSDAEYQQNQAKIIADEQQNKVDTAYKLFVSTGVATPEIASILGITPGMKTAEYQNMIADNARQSANASGGSDDTSGLSKNDTVLYKDITSYIGDVLTKKDASGNTYIKNDDLYKYVQGLFNQGVSEDVIRRLTTKYNIQQPVVQQKVNTPTNYSSSR